MFKKYIPAFFCIVFPLLSSAQQQKPDTVTIGKNIITLSAVVANTTLNIPTFISRIQKDSSFYKAFKNLHILGFTALNDIRMMDKENNTQASLYRKTKQIVKDGCRTMETLEQQSSGDIFYSDSSFNYYTAQMYASLFFTKGSVCGENNIVGNEEFSTGDKSGIEKHKEQLKMLFFNPGKKIPGIPFISNKTAI